MLNPTKPRGLTPQNEATFWGSMLVPVSITVLKHALTFLHRTRGLQRLPNETPHFTDAVRASLACIRVTRCHPQGKISFTYTLRHVQPQFSHWLEPWSANVLICTFHSTLKTTLPPCLNTARDRCLYLITTRQIKFNKKIDPTLSKMFTIKSLVTIQINTIIANT